MTLSLLIADDSDLIRARLPRILDGIEGVDAIHIASTLAQAMECVRQTRPSLPILDLNLPDGNAIQMIGPLKRLTPEVQIAIFTNAANAFNSKKCLQAGADWFFDKSLELNNLLDLVREQAALSLARHNGPH